MFRNDLTKEFDDEIVLPNVDKSKKNKKNKNISFIFFRY